MILRSTVPLYRVTYELRDLFALAFPSLTPLDEEKIGAMIYEHGMTLALFSHTNADPTRTRGLDFLRLASPRYVDDYLDELECVFNFKLRDA